MQSHSPHTPLVSALICNFNYGSFLEDAIQSALHQTYDRLEVVVVDDGSSDHSWEVLQRQPASVRRLRTPRQGQLAAFCAAIQVARGDIVCLLDSDDAWLPSKVEEVVQVFNNQPETQWVRHHLIMADVMLKPMVRVPPGFSATGPSPRSPYRYLEKTLTLSTTGLSIRRPLASFAMQRLDLHLRKRAADRPFGGIRYHADACLLAILGPLQIPGFLLDRDLALYRRHPSRPTDRPSDLASLLKQEIAVGRLISHIWSQESGHTLTATHIYKHILVLDAMSPRGAWTFRRARIFFAGLRAANRLLPFDLRLAARQTLALGYAFFAPRRWLNRFARRVL